MTTKASLRGHTQHAEAGTAEAAAAPCTRWAGRAAATAPPTPRAPGVPSPRLLSRGHTQGLNVPVQTGAHQAPPCTRSTCRLGSHVRLAPHPGRTAVWGATQSLSRPGGHGALTGGAGGQQAPSADTHLPQAGGGRLAGGVGRARQAGQQQAGVQGRVQAAVPQVLHQPAAEEGGRALELHAPHLKLHTCGGRRDWAPLSPTAVRAGPPRPQKGVVRPAAAPPQHRARGSQRPSDSGDPPPATNADEPREAAQHPARTEPRTQCHPLCTRCRPQHPSGHRCLWTQPPGDTAKQCDYLPPGRGFTGPFTFFFLAFYF